MITTKEIMVGRGYEYVEFGKFNYYKKGKLKLSERMVADIPDENLTDFLEVMDALERKR